MSKIRKPYLGSKRRLVLAIDVGTTFSGVSYAFLEPGEVPKIHGVTRFPGQEHVAGNSKIPSVIFYDREGKIQAVGAEAESAQVLSQAEDEGWLRVELFKLRLRPKTMKIDMNGMMLGPLPANKSSGDVLGDFLRYLYTCTRSFIEDTHANGPALWKSVHNDIHFVLSHPNGWEGAQQTKMRRSAIAGGLIPDSDEGKSRIRFVSEGEASLHACVLNGLAADMLSTGNGFIVADAGGGTLDISSYAIRGTSPLIIEEIAPADCVFAGAVFVSRRARKFLEEKLKNSKYGTADALDHITKRFDETTKRLFRDKNEPQFIPFGSPLDKDLKVGIRGGQLKLTGAEVAELFEPSIDAAVNSIKAQIQASGGIVKAVWLVGGFAANPWLFTQLQERLAPYNVSINRPDTQTSKAVADGAIGFFCDHHVSARMSKYMYGVEYLREMNAEDEDHVSRQARLLQMPSGPKLLPDAFDCILSKNVRVKESSVFSRKYYTEVTKLSTLSLFEIEIWCFRGGDEIPKWIERHSAQFGSLCHVQADLSKLNDSALPKTGANGGTYWTIVFSIEIHFGLTEFIARIKWNDNGETRYGPATIVYNERGTRVEDEDLASVLDDDMYMHEVLAAKARAPAQSHSKAPSPRHSRRQSPVGASVPEVPKAETLSDRSIRKKSKGKERELVSAGPSTPIETLSPFGFGSDKKDDAGKMSRSNSARSQTTLKSKHNVHTPLPASEEPSTLDAPPPPPEVPETLDLPPPPPEVPETLEVPDNSVKGPRSRSNSNASRGIIRSKAGTPAPPTPIETTVPASLTPDFLGGLVRSRSGTPAPPVEDTIPASLAPDFLGGIVRSRSETPAPPTLTEDTTPASLAPDWLGTASGRRSKSGTPAPPTPIEETTPDTLTLDWPGTAGGRGMTRSKSGSSAPPTPIDTTPPTLTPDWLGTGAGTAGGRSRKGSAASRKSKASARAEKEQQRVSFVESSTSAKGGDLAKVDEVPSTEQTAPAEESISVTQPAELEPQAETSWGLETGAAHEMVNTDAGHYEVDHSPAQEETKTTEHSTSNEANLLSVVENAFTVPSTAEPPVEATVSEAEAKKDTSPSEERAKSHLIDPLKASDDFDNWDLLNVDDKGATNAHNAFELTAPWDIVDKLHAVEGQAEQSPDLEETTAPTGSFLLPSVNQHTDWQSWGGYDEPEKPSEETLLDGKSSREATAAEPQDTNITEQAAENATHSQTGVESASHEHEKKTEASAEVKASSDAPGPPVADDEHKPSESTPAEPEVVPDAEAPPPAAEAGADNAEEDEEAKLQKELAELLGQGEGGDVDEDKGGEATEDKPAAGGGGGGKKGKGGKGKGGKGKKGKK